MRRRSLRAGFTLIELLVVIAIIAILASLVAVGLIPMKKKAYIKKTEAFLQKIQTALDSYFNEFKDYPPDGYDAEPGSQTNGPNATGWVIDPNDKGVYLGGNTTSGTSGGFYYRGSAVLVYFLCHPVNNIFRIGADNGENDARQNRVKTLPPFLSDLSRESFSVTLWDPTFEIAILPGDATRGWKAGWENCELLDAWGRPIHYDKVKDGSPTYFQGDRFNTKSGGKHTKSHPDAQALQLVLSNIAPSDENDACPTSTHVTYTAGSMGDTNGDPRCPPDPGDGCPDGTKDATGARNKGSYDLWSHGPSWTNVMRAVTNFGKS